MKFHHIGIATNDINNTLTKIKKFINIKDISDIVYDKNQEAYLCMITLDGGIKIELVSGKIVENFVKKRQYLYHTCYSTDNIETTIDEMISDGAYLVKDPIEAILFNNAKVAFLMCDLGLIELLEGDN